MIREPEVVTVRNAGATEPAEAVVRAPLRVRRWPRIPLLGPFVRSLPRSSLVVWLTLVAPPGEGWEFTRADFGPAGEYHLVAETVPEPAQDPALHDAAIHELAKDESVAEPHDLLIGTEGDAARRLLDLSLADAGYAPAVVEASVRSLIRAWRRFAIGDEDAYHAFAVLFLRIAAIVQVGDGACERILWWQLELDELEQHWRLVDAYARPELRALRDP